jgi:hypothetical protein
MKSKKIPFEILEDTEYLDGLSYDEFVVWMQKKNWSYHLHSCKISKQLEKFPGDKIILSRGRGLFRSLTTLKIIIKNRLKEEILNLQKLN